MPGFARRDSVLVVFAASCSAGCYLLVEESSTNTDPPQGNKRANRWDRSRGMRAARTLNFQPPSESSRDETSPASARCPDADTPVGCAYLSHRLSRGKLSGVAAAGAQPWAGPAVSGLDRVSCIAGVDSGPGPVQSLPARGQLPSPAVRNQRLPMSQPDAAQITPQLRAVFGPRIFKKDCLVLDRLKEYFWSHLLLQLYLRRT
jgi:hypothetical protein